MKTSSSPTRLEHAAFQVVEIQRRKTKMLRRRDVVEKELDSLATQLQELNEEQTTLSRELVRASRGDRLVI